ncbi:MAG: TM0106 family RecB-like putative nuclease [Candidatus Limnocylindria bacterium]
MQLIDGSPVFSATDLVGYLACEHLTNLERAAAAGVVARPERNDPDLEVIRRRGFEHEQRYLAELRDEGRRITEILPDGSIEDRGDQLRASAAATRAALARGDDVIYQATFFDGRWRGHADFLLRVERPSALGAWSYEVADTKLARHVKSSALLQICSYVDQLAAIQELEPDWMYVVLGGVARERQRFRVADFMAYYRSVKARFEAFTLGADAMSPAYPPLATYPDPVEHCAVCRWNQDCEARRRADDHLSLVAGISSHQRRALTERGVTTLEELAATTLPMEPRLDGVGAETVERIHGQARIQSEGRRRNTMLYELLRPVEPDHGLARLPPPSQGDLFFDIEGDPYAFDDGLEYLFGFIDPSERDVAGTPRSRAFWGTDRAAEKVAFERATDLMIERLDADPAMHVYHFAPYEPSAMKRLMGRHATREDEVDRLLRAGVFVDLHRVVKQGLRASVESYSIKKLEPLYGFTREIDLRDAGSSIVAFETWLQLGDEAAPADDPAILERIAAYNRDDCTSNLMLRDWLERLRVELEVATSAPVPRPGPTDGRPGEELAASQARVQELAERLTRGVSADPQLRTPEESARWLLAQLLSWHRRERKSVWWNYFRMRDLTPEECIDDGETIGGLTYEAEAGEVDRSRIHRYHFPVQEHKVDERATVLDPVTGKSPGSIVRLDNREGVIELKRGKNSTVPHPVSLMPHDLYTTPAQEESLYRIGHWVADHEVTAPGAYRAARDLLLRLPPRVGLRPGLDVALPWERPIDAARRLATALDGTTLAIQGPPGSGKTSTAARMIVSLVAAGRHVGITANSHKVIGLLLQKVVEAAREEGVPVRAIQKADEEQRCGMEEVRCTDDATEVRAALAEGTVDVAAGTAWIWSRGDFTESVDDLFIDEAGQFALANAIAVAGAARNVVLLGDPLQLDQPLQGTHPPGAERSALGHILGAAATMPPDQGLFLERTRRLHPDLCEFTSDAFYEGRLAAEERLAAQRFNVGLGAHTAASVLLLDGTGVRHLPVPHIGRQNTSPEEAEFVAGLVRSLVESGATWTDDDGKLQPVGYPQVLVVAPYNAHVRAIAALLPPQARVGTVDKFQGQEAPISIYSMATSTPEDAPRGMDFLYSRHRLNVATSRARCVSVLVCSPALLRVRARTPEQMRLANAFAQLLEHATLATIAAV